MEITINGKVYNVEKLDNGKWALPQEVKEALTITCSALNIDGNRVGTEKGTNGDVYNKYPQDNAHYEKVEGRYPAQTFIDSQVAEKLDRQSGIIKSTNNRKNKIGTVTDSPTSFGVANKEHEYNDTGGCSKILHKCDYEQIDFDLFIYQPKVSKKERNAGLDNFNNSAITDRKGNGLGRVCNICGAKQLSPCDCENNSWVLPANMKNNHPTLKPLSLNEKVLRLFKTPNSQRICYPFAGAGSEIIGGIKAGFDNWTACELNQDYIDIANARIVHWTNN